MIAHTKAGGANETLWFGDNLMTIRIAADSGEDGVSIVECRMPRDGSTPFYVELSGDEIVHVIDGSLRFRVDGNYFFAHSGQTVVAPKGQPHTFRIEPAEGGTCLIVTQGDEFEQMVREMSIPAASTDHPVRVERAPQSGQGFFDGPATSKFQVVGAPLL